jgi:hypothetical protein
MNIRKKELILIEIFEYEYEYLTAQNKTKVGGTDQS